MPPSSQLGTLCEDCEGSAVNKICLGLCRSVILSTPKSKASVQLILLTSWACTPPPPQLGTSRKDCDSSALDGIALDGIVLGVGFACCQCTSISISTALHLLTS